MKNILGNLARLIIIIVFIIAVPEILDQLIRTADIEGEYSIIHFYYILSLVLYFVLGALIGIDYLINERKKDGCWGVNFVKLLILGIPLGILSFAYFIYYSGFDLGIFNQLARGKMIFIPQIVFGYVVVSSFYKKRQVEREPNPPVPAHEMEELS